MPRDAAGRPTQMNIRKPNGLERPWHNRHRVVGVRPALAQSTLPVMRAQAASFGTTARTARAIESGEKRRRFSNAPP